MTRSSVTRAARRLRWARVFGLGLGLAVMAACHSGGERSGGQSLARVEAWIGQQEPALHAPEGVENAIVFRDMSLAGLGAGAGWRVADLELEPQADHMRVVGRGSDPRMSRAVEIEASQVRAVVLEGCANTDWPAQLHWARQGESVDHTTQVVGEKTGPCRQLFRVGQHPLWQGTIRRLLLKPVPAGGEGKLLALRAVRPAAAADWQGAYRVDLGGDLRLALLAKADQPFRQVLQVPAQAQVRAACGPTSARDRQGCVWQVREGATVLRTGELAATAAWQELELELGDWAGRQLELEIAPKEASLPLAIANPELWAWRKEESPARPNLVVISVDTLRADHLSLYGYSRPTSPAIAAWAQRRGVVFEQAVAAAPWTLPTHTTMLSGLEALRHGVNYSEPVPEQLDLLAEKLRRQGYRTLAFTGGAFLAPHFGLAQGFETFRYPRQTAPDAVEAGKDLEYNLEAALQTLDATAAPFFLFLHTYNVHAPFVSEPPPPEPLRSELQRVLAERGISRAQLVLHSNPGEWVLTERPGEFRVLKAQGADAELGRLLYDVGIARTDALLGRLFAFLQQSGLEKNTVVVLTADHGEALGEHALTGHDALYDVNLLVPLVIATPDGRHAGTRQKVQVRQSDLVPTLLELAQLPPDPALDGRSLVPLLAGTTPEAFPQLAVAYAASNNRGLALRWQGRTKWITPNSLAPGPMATPELYDLRADPGETKNLAKAAEPRATSLRQEARALYEASFCPWRFEVENPASAGQLHARWSGAKVNRFRLKSLDEPREARIDAAGHQKLTVELAPGGSVRFCLETLYPSPIELELSFAPPAGPPVAASYSLDPSQVGTRHWRYAGSQWEIGSGRLPSGIGLEVETRAGQLPGNLPVVDAELRRQLESLGYVD